MNYTETLETLCRLQEEVTRRVYDHSLPADCFCRQGGMWDSPSYEPDNDYQNAGRSIRFIVAWTSFGIGFMRPYVWVSRLVKRLERAWDAL